MIESFNCPDCASSVKASSAEMSSYADYNFKKEGSSDFCF